MVYNDTHVWYVDAGIEDTPEPVYTHCVVLCEFSKHAKVVQKRINRSRVRFLAEGGRLVLARQTLY